jgi:DNA-binding IclR family transcriptional regulator
LRLYSAIGRRLPAHATALGKALLARRSDATVDGLLSWPLPALTGNTITDRAALHAELALIRSRGWAADRQENTVGISCFAVGVPGGFTEDAISVSIPTARLTADLEDWVIGALLEVSGAA